MRCTICRPDLYNLKTRKKTKNIHNSRIEFSIDENNKKPQTETMLNLLDMSEICCVI